MNKVLFKNIEEALKNNLKNAKKSIKIAVAWFTNNDLFNIVAEKQRQGVLIEILLADDIINFSHSAIDFQSLINDGAKISVTRFPNLMHHKFCLIDNRILMSGSYNWTKSAELRNYENIILSTELNLIKDFIQEFDRLKEFSEVIHQINLKDFKEYSNEVERQSEKSALETFKESRENNEDIKLSDTKIDEAVMSRFKAAILFYMSGKHEKALEIAYTIIESCPAFPEAFDLVSTVKWRQNKFDEQISFALQAVEVDNLYTPAYNMLGIGYAKKNNAQKSIENYNICIEAEPDNYTYFKNRAVSYIDLESAFSVPQSLRSQFKRKADEDLNHAIQLSNRFEKEHDDYVLFYVRGTSYLLLEKLRPAKADLSKAMKSYNESPKEEQDIHIYREIKEAMKEIERAKQ